MKKDSCVGKGSCDEVGRRANSVSIDGCIGEDACNGCGALEQGLYDVVAFRTATEYKCLCSGTPCYLL